MEPWTLDQQDKELMESLQTLGPLLLGTRKGPVTNDEDRISKRHKPVASDATLQDQQPTQAAMVTMLKAVAQLVINHEKSLNHLYRQDCFVMYVQSDPQGALPVLQARAQQWRESNLKKDSPPELTMRTFLLAGLMQELHRRARLLSASKAGEQLWDTAIQKGTICPAGGWIFQKWSVDHQQLIPAQKASLPMPRMLKTLEQMEELLQHNMHVMRFHSLRNQGDVVPWCLQVTLRDPELWTLLSSITHNTVWSLLGMTVKQHNQQMSKQAIMLAEMMGKGHKSNTKGQGKGKTKDKATKQ